MNPGTIRQDLSLNLEIIPLDIMLVESCALVLHCVALNPIPYKHRFI